MSIERGKEQTYWLTLNNGQRHQISYADYMRLYPRPDVKVLS